ncbi:hypothetical protein EVAR_103487_1 [Eumeta japonica]|uniref:Uncharacterized protein n=1 Tax=Eumeta variegata TaxID=151549 RepID=A0A4C1ZHT1_EUMVA|nr:hypothetical protein EVAR_103487_1 [Eumeta japonica]
MRIRNSRVPAKIKDDIRTPVRPLLQIRRIKAVRVANENGTCIELNALRHHAVGQFNNSEQHSGRSVGPHQGAHLTGLIRESCACGRGGAGGGGGPRVDGRIRTREQCTSGDGGGGRARHPTTKRFLAIFDRRRIKGGGPRLARVIFDCTHLTCTLRREPLVRKLKAIAFLLSYLRWYNN